MNFRDKANKLWAEIAKWYDKVPKNIWICLITGCLGGFVCHFYMLTNKFPFGDDVNTFASNLPGADVGRWLLIPSGQISGLYSAPAINGALCIFFMAVAMCFMVSSMELKSLSSSILIPLVFLTFPAATSILCHMMSADSVSMSFMLAAIAVFLVRKNKWGFVFATAVMIAGMGIYQASLCMAATILVMIMILGLLGSDEDNSRKILFEGFKYLAFLGVSTIIYIIMSKLISPEMNEYAGMDSLGKVDFTQLPHTILIAYKRLLDYFVLNPKSFVNEEMYVAGICTVILIAVLIIVLFLERKTYKQVWKTVLLVLLCIAWPLAMSSIYVIAPKANVSMLMIYPYVCVYIMLIALSEAAAKSSNKHMLISALSIICIGFVIHGNYVLNNQAYLRMNVATERVFNFYNRVGTRVEAESGFVYGDRFTVIGDYYTPGMYNGNILSDEYRMQDEKYDDFSGVALENAIMTSGVRGALCRLYLGLPYENITDIRRQEITDTEEFKQMSEYPSDGSIKKIDDLWVVKFPNAE